MDVAFTPQFKHQFKKLNKDLQEDILEKIELFASAKNNQSLKIHKLSGTLKDRYSFSVSYKIRIIFVYLTKTEALLLAIGDHSIYNK